MWRTGINIYEKRTVRQVGYLQEQGTVLLSLAVPVTASTVPYVITIYLYSSENNYWACNMYSAYKRPSHHFTWCSQTMVKFDMHACRQQEIQYAV